MDRKELRNYVYEQHRQGLSDSQIAKRLNMTVDELAKLLDGEEENKVVVETAPKETETLKKRGRPKKVSGVPSTIEDVKEEPEEDLSWMED